MARRENYILFYAILSDHPLRAQDSFCFGSFLRYLAVGSFPLLRTRRNLDDNNSGARLHIARVTVGTGLLSIGLYALFGFHCFINHAQSYQAILEVMGGLVLILQHANRWYFNLCLKLSILHGVVVWILEPIASATYIYYLTATACLCLVAVWLYYLYFVRLRETASTCPATMPRDDR